MDQGNYDVFCKIRIEYINCKIEVMEGKFSKIDTKILTIDFLNNIR